MKLIDSKVVVAVIATALMAVSSPSISFATADDVPESFLPDLDFMDIRREAQCCESCDFRQVLSTMSHSGSWEEDDSSDEHNYRRDNRILRILTWTESKAELEAHADMYQRAHPEAPTVRIIDVPSLKELDYEVSSELRLGSTLFDGFVVPPLLMGNMLRPQSGQALAVWTEEEMQGFDLLPYYRYNVATYGGRLRGLPILSGSQALILFRKDYLDALKLPTPKTWEEWSAFASEFSNPKNPLFGGMVDKSNNAIYGACLGLLNEAGCRKRNSLGDGSSCKSRTMTYLGMVMASMTQYAGNSTGYMLGSDETRPNGLDPLFEPTLERALKWMEQQVENGSPLSLQEDSSQSMNHFREGRCAWTVSVDHDNDFLKNENIGFVPLPGSHLVLDRSGDASRATASMPETMINCTASLCPHGKDFVDVGRVNQAPFGAVDATVGTVSALISRARQEEVKEFFKFIFDSKLYGDYLEWKEPNKSRMQQPLTYSQLKRSNVPKYEETIKSLTSSPNAAIPFRVPNAFNLLSDLDERIYNYLVDGKYSDFRREKAARDAEKSWNAMISMYDFRRQDNKLPTSIVYEVSMGQHVPPPAPDLYIGWVARTIMWIIAGVSCLASIVAAVWVWAHKEERVIRASQPVFLYLICGGTFVMASSVFTLGIEDDIASVELTSATCMANYWLYSIGFTAVISALFSKMWMLGQVFQKPRNEQRIEITKQNILLPFFFIFGLDCLVLSIWTIFDRHVWNRVPINLNDPSSPTVGLCTSEDSVWFIGMLFIFNMGILFLSLVQSYECRRITTEYNESSWVTMAITVTAQAWFIGLPLLVLIDDPTIWFILIGSTVLCTTLPILLLIFIPKILYSIEARKSTSVRMSTEDMRKKLFYDDRSHDRSADMADMRSSDFRSSDFISGEITIAESADSARGSFNSLSYRRQDPKGTIGIRIILFTYLDQEEVEELEDAVEFAEERNKELKLMMGRLKDNIEEHHIVKKHMFRNAPRFSMKSIGPSGEQSIIAGDIGSIIEAKPDSRRRSRKNVYMA